MTITLSLGDIGMFILFLLLLTVGIFLIITLKNLNELIKKATNIVNKNEVNINQSLEDLPHVMNNVKETTTLVKDGLHKTEETIYVLRESLIETASTVSSNTNTLINYVSFISEIARSVIDIFRDDKKK
ncbi:hypothetical protein HYG86_15190 [Alkalicella caledoniensis]|uniref:DUF948 domain-containing protein n=1 Tax=Alkalicella caledoniensis TaxID=2731377 RepID=A0A7G9WBF4_ALKCA|nr:hypothetical protein [Alkalicella caledoniensis]QNO16016.1 hypothetical protein HYG86_15190 [Alkalicella caledoniensis]